ncbi:hypothetical protein ABPG72_005532 [Tetrahymena utriculariae]
MDDYCISSQGNSDAVKIVVLGQGGVGKTCMILRLRNDDFDENYVPTLQDTYHKNLVVDGLVTQLEILDTAGQEDYEVLRDMWIRNGQCFILMYSINNQESFEDVKSLVKRIEMVKCINQKTFQEMNIQIIIVGSKLDLDNERQVKRELAENFAKQHNLLFKETSAKTGQGCVEVFEDLIRKQKNQQKDINQKQSKSKTKPKKKRKFRCTLI